MKARETTIRELREFVETASRDNPHLTSRLEKAAFLVLLRPIVALEDSRYQVGAEDGLRNYAIQNGHCECTDYLRHGPGHSCKHRLALAIYLRLQQPALPAPPSGLPPAPPEGNFQNH